MASFLSTLSLLILVLFNGCFTVPIIEQQDSSSTLSTLINDLTTEFEVNTRLVSVNESSPLFDIEHQHVSDEHMGYNMSTSVYNSTEEQSGQLSRSLEEFLSSSPMTFTNEESSTNDAYYSNGLFSSTSESTTNPDQHEKRYQDEVSSSTIESTTSESATDSFTRALRGLEADFENDTDTEHGERAEPIELTTDSMLFSTSASSFGMQQLFHSQPSRTQKYVGLLKDDDDEQQHNHQHNQEQELQADHIPDHAHEHEVEPEHKPEPQPEDEPEHKPKPKHKPEPKPEAEHEPEGEHEHEHEHEHEPHPHPEHKDERDEKEPMKPVPSEGETGPESEIAPTKKPKMPSHDDSQDDNSKEATAPTAFFDQEALKGVSYPLNNALVLDENNSLIVTDIPRRFSTSTIKNLEEVTKLNQGEESLHVEEKESNH